MAGQSTPSYGMTSSHTNITEIVGTYLFSHVQLLTMTICFFPCIFNQKISLHAMMLPKFILLLLLSLSLPFVSLPTHDWSIQHSITPNDHFYWIKIKLLAVLLFHIHTNGVLTFSQCPFYGGMY